MVHPFQQGSSLSSQGNQLADALAEIEIGGPYGSLSSGAGPSVTDSSAPDLRTISATSTSPGSQTQIRPRASSFRKRSFSQIKAHATSIATTFAGMIALPVINEVVDGVQAFRAMSTGKEKLIELEERLRVMSCKLNSDPRLLAADPIHAQFSQRIDDLHTQVCNELKASLARRFDVASRLDALEEQFTQLIFGAIKTGHLTQPKHNIPDEFDSTIKTLKIVNEGNGLVIHEHIGTRRYDEWPVNESRSQLHVYTYRAMYNDVPVELEDYYGGPDDYLLRTVTELVDHYNQRGLNPVLQRLYGGSAFKDQAGRLHVGLVLSPREGTPWVKLVMVKRSVELLCQIAEKTAIIFQQLKHNKQMNFDDIRVRSDGTLLLVPHTEGDNFLLASSTLDENVFDPFSGDDYQIGWPLGDLCGLLHESSKQGLVPEAVAALREHDGTWDQIAVWRIARDIGLRPPSDSSVFNCYPPPEWTTDPGWIIHWPNPPSIWNEPDGCFTPVARLDESMIGDYERQHLTSFKFTMATGTRGGELIDYLDASRHEDWLLPAQQDDWEYFPLEDWQNIETITLMYESVRLEREDWGEWEYALKTTAQETHLRKENLGVVTKTDVLMKIHKNDVPELGTRPVYFHRRRLSADTSPRQFWGFFSFNQDPLGPTGLAVRCSGPNQWGHVASESLPPYPPNYDRNYAGLEINIEHVNMYSNWGAKIQRRREWNRHHKIEPRYSEDLEWEMDYV
ncbi:unnamed protein product [Rhizoctonia solani]|uniref:Uncharacterized protein n=1 Tax=Rhizoctonia solani TaxID=456999 RepID=A0A8H2XZ92_9AGAM|nr:unnamed protein product [Rhizoctonia solani]